MMVLHSCDMPSCVNPDHLFLGTNQDNVSDMMRKGRHVKGGTYANGKYRKGSDHQNAKITEDKVIALRADYAAGGYSQLDIANKYGLGLTTAHKIISRKTWLHV